MFEKPHEAGGGNLIFFSSFIHKSKAPLKKNVDDAIHLQTLSILLGIPILFLHTGDDNIVHD